MTTLTVSLSNIQHVRTLTYTFDLQTSGLVAIVGRNGAGKSTLARALRMLSFADTFAKTASGAIFSVGSRIEYRWNGASLAFTYDPSLRTLNCRSPIAREWKMLASCELSIPHGERFNFFKSISDADLEIRRALIVGDYTTPHELISFLRKIYNEPKFDDLVEIHLKKSRYYCIRMADDRYFREDYFSSGEYFLLSLYRRIRTGYKLIFIDEIDISLDASAQVRLVDQLRLLCAKYQVKIAFTTHSLAMMRTLESGELNYMEIIDGAVTVRPASYNFLKSLLYGFRGWDRYILTEDEMLKNFLTFVIERYCRDIFYRYLIVYVGGGGNVSDMLERNAAEGFFSEPRNVIAVLDGDQGGKRPSLRPNTCCIPVESVEKAVDAFCLLPGLLPRLGLSNIVKDEKSLHKLLISRRLMSERDMFEAVCNAHNDAMRAFASTHLQDFLSLDTT
jgi:ABC-type lipoprotein export system ATPase subunit